MPKGSLELDSAEWHVKLIDLFLAAAISRLVVDTQTLRGRFDRWENA